MSRVRFRKSSKSHTGGCIGVALCTCSAVLLRDEKHPQGDVLAFTEGSWDVFITAIESGQLANLKPTDGELIFAGGGEPKA